MGAKMAMQTLFALGRRCASLTSCRACPSIGTQGARMACWDARLMECTQSVASALNALTRQFRALRASCLPRTNAHGPSAASHLLAISGTRHARWATWVVGQMTYMQNVDSVA